MFHYNLIIEDQNIRITLNVPEEKLDTINHLFSHYGWNYNEVTRGETDKNLSNILMSNENAPPTNMTIFF